MTPEQISSTLAGILMVIADINRAIEAERQARTEAIEAQRQVYQVQMAELREGQALLVQMFAEERQQFQEFRITVNRFMDQVDRRLNLLENKGG